MSELFPDLLPLTFSPLVSPAKDLSVAGLRAGLAGARSGLWWQFRRIARQLRPRFFVLENVPGLLSSAQGRDFAVLLRGLAKLGYRLAWRVLDSQYDRVAQRRRRVFVVGSLGDERCAEILFEPESLRWDSALRRGAGQDVAATVSGSPPSRRNGGSCPTDGHFVTGTLPARTQGGGGLGTDFDLNEGLVAGTLQASGKAAGSATQQDAESGLLIPLARCVMSGEGRRNPYDTCTLVTAPLTTRPYADHESKESLLVTGTLLARDGGRIGCDFDLAGGLVTHTLRAEGDGNDPGVPLVPVADTLTGSWHNSNGATAGNNVGIINPIIGRRGSTMGVRRLTPRECERLQAFPDDWTRWTDAGREQADGPRYKQLGNAVTVNVAEWIGSRITTALH